MLLFKIAILRSTDRHDGNVFTLKLRFRAKSFRAKGETPLKPLAIPSTFSGAFDCVFLFDLLQLEILDLCFDYYYLVLFY